MAQKSIPGSAVLAEQIKRRRNQLGLTIEEAADRADVGTKTWCRYEAGESIRKDKCKGICKALNWDRLPEQDAEDEGALNIEECKSGEAWSAWLEQEFGVRAAFSFAAGSDILLDKINEDMGELSRLPAGSHLGQLDVSWLADDLPAQFLMRYDYEFLYHMRCALLMLRHRAKMGQAMIAHSILEELLIYLCNGEAGALIELSGGAYAFDGEDEFDDGKDWVFDLFGDMDIITCLYSDLYLKPDDAFYYDQWDEQQFYME